MVDPPGLPTLVHFTKTLVPTLVPTSVNRFARRWLHAYTPYSTLVPTVGTSRNTYTHIHTYTHTYTHIYAHVHPRTPPTCLLVLLDGAYERTRVLGEARERVTNREVGGRAVHEWVVGQAGGAFEAPLAIAMLVFNLPR